MLRCPSERFLTYDHPGGQSLQDDFSALSAAVEAVASIHHGDPQHDNGCGGLAGRENAEATFGASRHHELPEPQPTTPADSGCTGGSIGWLLTGRNAPSYYAWSLNITVQGETESPSPKGGGGGKVPNAHMVMPYSKVGTAPSIIFPGRRGCIVALGFLYRLRLLAIRRDHKGVQRSDTEAKNLLDAHVGFVIELLPQSVALRDRSIR